MDTQQVAQILGALQVLFSETRVAKEDIKQLAYIKQLVNEADHGQRETLKQALLGAVWPADNVVALCFFLYDLFKEQAFLNKLGAYLPGQLSPALFYGLYWNLANRVFTGTQSNPELSSKMRDYHQSLSCQVNALLNSYGLRKKRCVTGGIKRVAILTPQLLHMRHSPTREAYSIALHLEHYFGVNAFVVNTNGLTYGNPWQLIEPVDSHSNRDLKGVQSLSINYMQFRNAKLNLVSFEPELMTTRKVASIMDTLSQLNIDAVIAHGENLLVQEAVYGVYPSLFATTGSVVPMAHSDAYFIPGDLFTEHHKNLAERYGHSDFLMETMLVTPQGEADKACERTDLGLKPSDFIYLVVGTRLKSELCEEFIHQCKALLESDERSVIAFAGTSKLPLTDFFDAEYCETRRVINLGFHNDLPGLCKMSDAYLNPSRQGGGTSSQTAILNGLPIVTLDKGHISAVVPGKYRHNDWASYLRFAKRLRDESEFKTECVSAFSSHYTENLNTRQQVETIFNKLQDIARRDYAR